MEVKKNKLVSDNKALSDNLNNNTVASNNNIGNDNFSKNSLFSFINCFNGLDKTIALLFPSIREAMVERYRAETLCRIGIKATDILQILGISANPIPPKGAIPLFDKLSLEHEEEMYDLWAKLLVEAATDYNPIQLQYADVLSQIGSEEAILLKAIYQKQSQISIHDNIWTVINQIKGVFGRTYSVYYNGETFNRENIIDVLYPYGIQANTSIVLLEQLGLISRFFNQRLSSNRQPNEPSVGLYLTEFGYSMIDCLEGKYNATEELSK